METSEKIGPIEDGGDQKETEETEDSSAQQRAVQTDPREEGKALKVTRAYPSYAVSLILSSLYNLNRYIMPFFVIWMPKNCLLENR